MIHATTPGVVTLVRTRADHDVTWNAAFHAGEMWYGSLL